MAFVLTERLVYVPPEGDLPPVEVPATRRTNWGSIPELLESATALDGLRCAYPFTIHDEVHLRGPEIGYDREMGDLVMRRILHSMDETKREADRCWRILRLFGRPAWEQCRA